MASDKKCFSLDYVAFSGRFLAFLFWAFVVDVCLVITSVINIFGLTYSPNWIIKDECQGRGNVTALHSSVWGKAVIISLSFGKFE